MDTDWCMYCDKQTLNSEDVYCSVECRIADSQESSYSGTSVGSMSPSSPFMVRTPAENSFNSFLLPPSKHAIVSPSILYPKGEYARQKYTDFDSHDKSYFFNIPRPYGTPKSAEFCGHLVNKSQNTGFKAGIMQNKSNVMNLDLVAKKQAMPHSRSPSALLCRGDSRTPSGSSHQLTRDHACKNLAELNKSSTWSPVNSKDAAIVKPITSTEVSDPRNMRTPAGVKQDAGPQDKRETNQPRACMFIGDDSDDELDYLTDSSYDSYDDYLIQKVQSPDWSSISQIVSIPSNHKSHHHTVIC